MRGYGSALIAMLSLGALGCQREAAAPTEQKRIEAQDIDRVLAESDALLLDVRDPEEIEELGTIEGYVNIPSRSSNRGSTSFHGTRPSSPPETPVDEPRVPRPY